MSNSNCIKAVMENNHFPGKGRYCNAMVDDPQSNKVYFYDCYGNYIWWGKNGGTDPEPVPDTFTVTLPITNPTEGDFFAWSATDTSTAIRFLAKREGGIGATVNVKKNGIQLLQTDLSLSIEEAWLEGEPLTDTVFTPGDTLAFEVTAIAGSIDLISFSMEFQQNV